MPTSEPTDAASEPYLVVVDHRLALAGTYCREFTLRLWPDGRAEYVERARSPSDPSEPMRFTATLEDRADEVRAMFADAGFDAWPEGCGNVRDPTEIRLRGADGAWQTRFVGFYNTDWERVFASALAATDAPEVVARLERLMRALSSRESAPTLLGPLPPDEQCFPSRDDRRQRRRAVFFSETHDWDGAERCHRILEVRFSENGVGERREVAKGAQYRVLQRWPITRDPEQTRAVFAALDALDPWAMRARIGGGELETVYSQTFAYFNGDRTTRFEYVWTRERGLGSSDGGNPPNATEAAALRIIRALG